MVVEKAGWRVPWEAKSVVKLMGDALQHKVTEGEMIGLAVLRLAEELAGDATLGDVVRSGIRTEAQALRTALATAGLALNRPAAGAACVEVMAKTFDAKGKIDFLLQFTELVRSTPALSHLRVAAPTGKLIRIFRGAVSMPYSVGFVLGDLFRVEIFADLHDPVENERKYAEWHARKDDLQLLFGEDKPLTWEGPWAETRAFRIAHYIDLKNESVSRDSLLHAGLALLARFDRTFGGLIPPGRNRRR